MVNTSSGQVRRRGQVAISDRSLNRLIAACAALIALALPVIVFVYWSDRHVDGGGSIAQREIQAAEAAVRADPNKISARLGLGLAYAAAGRNEDAVAQYAVVLDVEANNKAALLGRGDALRASGQLDAAALDYLAIVDQASTGEMTGADRMLQAAYYGLGVIALAQEQPSDAARHLATAVALNRADADALYALGTALTQINDLPNAVAALRDAVALVPTGWCEPYAQLDRTYLAAGDADGAAYARGMTALCEGRKADALALLQPLVGGSYTRDAHIGLALTAEAMNDVPTAIEHYSAVYTANPGDFAAINGLNRLGAVVGTPAPVETER